MEIGKVALYCTGDGEFDYTADEAEARAVQKDGKAEQELFRIKKGNKEVPAHPSDINHGNVTPSVSRAKEALHGPGKTEIAPRDRLMPGGITMRSARQTTVLSMAALRRLRFPAEGEAPLPARDEAARTVLAALGLVALTAARRDYFLRSRCDLYAPRLSSFEIVSPGVSSEKAEKFSLDFEDAVRILDAALTAAETEPLGLKWKTADELPRIVPSKKLVGLIVIGRGQAGSETDSGEDPV
jgi:CRISPR-associated protein Csb1